VIKTYSQFVPGYYYTLSGEKVKGWIRHDFSAKFGSGGDNTIKFKSSSEEKKKKFNSKEICCFVIGKDSFAVVRNFEMNAFAYYDEDFAKVISAGKLVLYEHFSTVPSGSAYGGTYDISNYLISKNGGQVRKIKRGNFKELMSELVSDNAELVNKINNKEIKFDQIVELVNIYNTWAVKDK